MKFNETWGMNGKESKPLLVEKTCLPQLSNDLTLYVFHKDVDNFSPLLSELAEETLFSRDRHAARPGNTTEKRVVCRRISLWLPPIFEDTVSHSIFPHLLGMQMVVIKYNVCYEAETREVLGWYVIKGSNLLQWTTLLETLLFRCWNRSIQNSWLLMLSRLVIRKFPFIASEIYDSPFPLCLTIRSIV